MSAKSVLDDICVFNPIDLVQINLYIANISSIYPNEDSSSTTTIITSGLAFDSLLDPD